VSTRPNRQKRTRQLTTDSSGRRWLAALERVAKVQMQDGLLLLLDAGDVLVFKASRRAR